MRIAHFCLMTPATKNVWDFPSFRKHVENGQAGAHKADGELEQAKYHRRLELLFGACARIFFSRLTL